MAFPADRPFIPVFPLYGESGTWSVPEPMHCESIAARSALHGWEIRPHRHEDLCQILFLRKGHAEVTFDGRVEPLDGPALIFVPARMVHGFRFSPGMDGEVVTTPSAVLRRLLDGERAPSLAAPVLLPLADGIGRAAEADFLSGCLAQEFARPRPGRLAALESLLTLLFLATARGRPEPHGGGPQADPRIARFYEMVEENYTSHRPIADYARRLNITPVRLNTLLRIATGCSALEIIHQRLLLEARRSLLYTTLRVGAIAEGLGFADVGYFSRFFHKKTGLSPRAFRRSGLTAFTRPS